MAVVFMSFSFSWRRGYTPGILYEYQNKGVVKFAIRKWMKRKGMDDSNWEQFEG
jgi:hypothetical protein